jgi:hypothetical protein
MKGLTELAELLLEKEVIFSEDLERIFGRRKADLIKEQKELADGKKADAVTVAEKEESGKSKKKKKNKPGKTDPESVTADEGIALKKSKNKE